MTKQIFFAFILQLALISCIDSQNKTFGEYNNETYNDCIRRFDKKLISHFPKEITFFTSNLNCSSNERKNDIGFVLYLYEVKQKELDSLNNYLNNCKMKARYDVDDSCLLIVNRFETIETLENYELPVIRDSSLINKSCYENKYPIPNFIEYKEVDTNTH